MPMTTPPFAVPSSFVSTMPVTPSASWNWRAWAIAFWPFVASRTSSTSCGAPSAALRDDALHLLQLLHERRLRVEPAGGVAEDDVHAAPAAPRWTASKQTLAGSAPSLPRTIGRADALGPDLELLARGGAERVARAEQDLVARRAGASPRACRWSSSCPEPFTPTTMTTHGRAAPTCERRARRAGAPSSGEDARDLLAERGLQPLGVRELRRLRTRSRAVSRRPRRGLHADVGGEQDLLEVGEDASSTTCRPGEERVQPRHEAAARLLEPGGERLARLGLGARGAAPPPRGGAPPPPRAPAARPPRARARSSSSRSRAPALALLRAPPPSAAVLLLAARLLRLARGASVLAVRRGRRRRRARRGGAPAAGASRTAAAAPRRPRRRARARSRADGARAGRRPRGAARAGSRRRRRAATSSDDERDRRSSRSRERRGRSGARARASRHL